MEVYVNPNDIDMILELYKTQDKTFVIKSFPKNNVKRRCNFYIEGKECLIDFFIKKDKKVRIQPVGKNIEYANKVLDFFKTKTMNANVETKTCTINCKEIIVNRLVEYIKEDCSQLVNIVKNNNIIKFEGYNGDTVTCTFYKTTSKLMIQAKPLYTFSLIISYLSQFDEIEFDEIIEVTNKLSGQSISKEVIRNDMKKILVKSYVYLDEALKKSISGSLILLKRKEYSEDYTGYITGEFKALEGYLKKILTQKYNYTFDRNKPNFSMFAKNPNNPQNKSEIEMDNKISNAEKDALKSLYNIYKNKRNIYLHSRIDPSQTRVIENLSEAQRLSDEILDSIEKSYNIIFR